MKYEYTRIDLMHLLMFPELRNWLDGQADVEYREDYQCYFIRKDTQTHTWLALTYGELLES